MSTLTPFDEGGFPGTVSPPPENPGPQLWVFSLVVCLSGYCLLLPLMLAVRYYVLRGQESGQYRAARPRTSQITRRGRQFTALVADDDTASSDSRMGRIWHGFQTEEYTRGNGEQERSDHEPVLDKDQGHCAWFLSTMLEHHPSHASSSWQRQRHQRKWRTLRALIREELHHEKRMQESASNPLLVSSSSPPQHDSMRRNGTVILQLGWRLATPEFIQGLLNLSTLILLGRGMETSDLVGYLVITAFLGWTLDTIIAGGLFRALQQVSQSSDSRLEVGRYVQITLTALLAFQMPFWIVWVFVLEYVMAWLHLDEPATKVALDYGYIFMVLGSLRGFSACVHFLLVRAKHETYSQMVILLEQALVVLVAGIWTSLDQADLITYGLLQLELAVTFLVWNVGFSLYKGWLEDYQPGFIGNCAFTEKEFVVTFLKQSLPFMAGNLFLGSTWQVLMFLAAYLGPAEFATWCILGILWDSLSGWIEGIGFAGSLRCEALLVLGKSEEAFRAAIVAMLIPAVSWIIVVSVLLLVGDYLPSWITKDATIQDLLTDLMPHLEIGLAVTSIGSVHWALLACQGRNHVAAFVSWLATWFITIPLATTFTIHLLMELQGQTVAYVLGALLSGAIQFYAFYCFRWNETVKEATTSTLSTVTNSWNYSSRSANTQASKKGLSESRGLIQPAKSIITPTVSQTTSIANSQKIDDGDQNSTASSSSSDGFLDDLESFADPSLHANMSDNSTLSSFQTSSTATESNSAVTTDTATTAIRGQRFAMASGPQPPSQHLRRQVAIPSRHPPPMSPLMEESSSASASTSAQSASKSSSGTSSVQEDSVGSGSTGTLMGYRRNSDLGSLSRKDLLKRQAELHKMINALKATLRFKLTASKLRILEELRWVLIVSPDIVEVDHLEHIIGMLHIDEDCRRELWSAIKMYLPTVLQKMGLETLLKNEYLGSHHLKARMDKFVMETRAESNSLEDELSVVNDDQVHRDCEFQQTKFTFPSCFVLHK